MKKVVFILLVVVMVVMNSCYDEPQVQFSSADIVGVWYGASGATNHIGTFTFNADGTYIKSFVSSCFDYEEQLQVGTYKFYKDNTNANGYHIELYSDDKVNKEYPSSDLRVKIFAENAIYINNCKYIRR